MLLKQRVNFQQKAITIQSTLTSHPHTIKNGDTLSGIIAKLYGIQPKDSRFQKAKDFLLSINPQIKNPNQIYPGLVLRVGES